MRITRRHIIGGLGTGLVLTYGGEWAFAQQRAVRAAIVMPGSITDSGWSQAGFEAMQTAKSKLGIETAYTEKVHQPDQVEVISGYARRGFTHVIGHGGEFQDAIERVAARFPNVMFVVTNGLKAGGNVATADFYFSQPAYLLGFLAGRTTKTGKVGIIAAQKFKFTNDTVAGYEAGFKLARQDGQVLTAWTGDWDDVAKGKVAALSQISQGADIIWPTMDSATVGSLQAVRERGVKAFGLYYDAIEKWPDIILQSAILDIREVILKVLETARSSGLAAQNYKYDLNTPSAVRIGSYHPSIPTPVVAEVNELLGKLKSGAVVAQPV